MKQKALSEDRALLREVWYFSSVEVERFELQISCSQSRLNTLYKSNFTSVSVVEIEPFYKQKTPRMWGFKYLIIIIILQK